MMPGEPPQEEEPCKELLRRFEQEHFAEAKHDIEEITAVTVIVLLYVVCVLFSVAVDLATAIESLPALGMVGYHKREAVMSVARKIAVPPVIKRKSLCLSSISRTTVTAARM